MAVKLIRLDYPVGSNIQLPDYIKSSTFMVSLDKVENNLCAWACFAIINGSRRDRYLTQAKELFASFYGIDKKYKKLSNGEYKEYNKLIDEKYRKLLDEEIRIYAGFDFVNELDRYEATTKYVINIIFCNEDKSIEYIRKSEFNDTKERKFLNIYDNHLSVVTNLF